MGNSTTVYGDKIKKHNTSWNKRDLGKSFFKCNDLKKIVIIII